jgi:hypothetical protein
MIEKANNRGDIIEVDTYLAALEQEVMELRSDVALGFRSFEAYSKKVMSSRPELAELVNAARKKRSQKYKSTIEPQNI